MARLSARPYQFSLAALLLIVTLVSVGLSVFAVLRERNAKEHALLKQLGGSVTYEQWEGSDLRALHLSLSGAEDLTCLRHFVNLRELEIDGPGVTDRTLAFVDAQKRLQRLYVLNPDRSKLTGAGLSHVRALTSLKSLTYMGGRLTDAGMQHLENLSNLEDLCLWCPEATDEGLRYLAKLDHLGRLMLANGPMLTGEGLASLPAPKRLKALHMLNCAPAGLRTITRFSNMEELQIHGQKVGDEGMAYLAELPQLRVLDLTGTAITQASMPNLLRIQTLERLYVPFSIQVTPQLRTKLSQALPNLEYLKSANAEIGFSPPAQKGAEPADDGEDAIR